MIQGWYLNLDRCPERRDAMERQLADLGLSGRYRRLAAVDGRTLPPATDCPLTPGQRGCWRSHVQALAHSDADRHTHVLEDDAVIHPHCPAVLAQFLQQHDPGDWDLLYTDIVVPHDVGNVRYLIDLWRQFRQDRQVRFLQINQVAYAAATSYLVNRHSRHRLITFLNEAPEQHPYDLHLRRLARAGRLRAYVCFPFFTTLSPLSDQSNIRSDEPAWQLFDVFRRSFYADARPEELLRHMPPPAHPADPHGRIYLRLVEAMLDPSFTGF